jgi:hypothetical protein
MKFSAIGKPAGCKLIRLDAEVEKGVLVAISIRGDFFAIPEEGFERAEARLPGTRVTDLAVRFTQLMQEEGVEPYGISGEGLAEVLIAGMKGAGDGASA